MARSAAQKRKPRRYRSLLWRWAAQLGRRPKKLELAPLPNVGSGQVSVTRGGHATMLIRYSDQTVLCDPVLTRTCRGMARINAVGLSRETIEQVTLVLISSLEPDHLHPKSLAELPRSATVVLPSGGASELSELGFHRVVELKAGSGFNQGEVHVISADGTLGSLIYVLYGDGPSVLFCGGSGYSDVFKELSTHYRPDISLLPIGGYCPSSFRTRHLSPLDALKAFDELHSRVMIPHRYGTFTLSYERLDDPSQWLAELIRERGLERYVEPIEVGESRLFVPPRTRMDKNDVDDIQNDVNDDIQNDVNDDIQNDVNDQETSPPSEVGDRASSVAPPNPHALDKKEPPSNRVSPKERATTNENSIVSDHSGLLHVDWDEIEVDLNAELES